MSSGFIMAKRREISNTVRGQIYTLFEPKKSYSYISKQFSVSNATVSRVIKSAAATSNQLTNCLANTRELPAKTPHV